VVHVLVVYPISPDCPSATLRREGALVPPTSSRCAVACVLIVEGDHDTRHGRVQRVQRCLHRAHATSGRDDPPQGHREKPVGAGNVCPICVLKGACGHSHQSGPRKAVTSRCDLSSTSCCLITRVEAKTTLFRNSLSWTTTLTNYLTAAFVSLARKKSIPRPALFLPFTL
jgi:hypothetical protein